MRRPALAYALVPLLLALAIPSGAPSQTLPSPAPAPSVALPVPRQPGNNVSDLPLPDPKLTPGRVADADIRDVCDPGYAERQGYLDPANVRETFNRYHVPGPLRLHRFVVDRLVPATLGGAATLDNLWAVPLEAERRKRAIEQSLVEDVCSGGMPLAEAQRRMLADWRTAVTW
jgi:hypothetical protein